MTIFSLNLLQSISDWQRGGDQKQNRTRGKQLKAAIKNLPDEFRECSLCCFRQVALPKSGVWDLIGDDRLEEKISSWTTDIELAKSFKNGVPPKGGGYQGVILCVMPKPESVVVNLQRLYVNAEFKAAMAHEKTRITGYHDGAGRFSGTQSEVVLEIASVTQQDIYSIGGHSSPFDVLLRMAAEERYGPNPTEKQLKSLLLNAEHLQAEAGPCWLSPDATKRVLDKLQPHVDNLQHIKRLQAQTKSQSN